MVWTEIFSSRAISFLCFPSAINRKTSFSLGDNWYGFLLFEEVSLKCRMSRLAMPADSGGFCWSGSTAIPGFEKTQKKSRKIVKI